MHKLESIKPIFLVEDTFFVRTGKVYLNLGRNKISRISAKALDKLINLRVIWLDNNELKSLPDDIFYECVHIEQINLGANQEKNLKFLYILFISIELFFIFMKNFFLNMKIFNKLEYVQHYLFAELAELKQVFLQGMR